MNKKFDNFTVVCAKFDNNLIDRLIKSTEDKSLCMTTIECT